MRRCGSWDELMKWAPTSANGPPARFAFVRSKEAKERLRPALAPLNVEKVLTAPVTVIVGLRREILSTSCPGSILRIPRWRSCFKSNPEMVENDRQSGTRAFRART